MTTRGSSDKSFPTKRLLQEYTEIMKNPPPLATAQIRGENLTNWIATIEGPPGTPYEGGKFKLSLKFSSLYPFQPPDVRFTTKIYHANVDSDGTICLDILHDEWTPAMNVRSLLLSICSLMADCNPYSPLRQDIASLYMYNRKEHNRRAREYDACKVMKRKNCRSLFAFLC